MIRFLIFCVCTLFSAMELCAQVTFGLHSDDEISVTAVTPLVFGDIMQHEGERHIEMDHPDRTIIEITGRADKHIYVTIQYDDNLHHIDGSASIPFTIQAAYANQGRENAGDAIVFTGSEARFPILKNAPYQPETTRQQGNEGPRTPQATAYLYLYGSLQVGNIPPGNYAGNINVFVSYD